jgi:hypothetical protein
VVKDVAKETFLKIGGLGVDTKWQFLHEVLGSPA